MAKDERHDSGPSTASILGGVALVGAAAGYAALAMRFRTFASTAAKANRFAEMRAAEAFSKDWAKTAEPFFKGEGARVHQGFTDTRERAHHKQRQRQHHQQEQEDRRRLAQEQQADIPPEWALRMLGLGNKAVSLAEAKAAYRERALTLHPDSGGDAQAFQRLGDAWKAVEQQKSTVLSRRSDHAGDQ
jgi:hypothetical protein